MARVQPRRNLYRRRRRPRSPECLHRRRDATDAGDTGNLVLLCYRPPPLRVARGRAVNVAVIWQLARVAVCKWRELAGVS